MDRCPGGLSLDGHVHRLRQRHDGRNGRERGAAHAARLRRHAGRLGHHGRDRYRGLLQGIMMADKITIEFDNRDEVAMLYTASLFITNGQTLTPGEPPTPAMT